MTKDMNKVKRTASFNFLLIVLLSLFAQHSIAQISGLHEAVPLVQPGCNINGATSVACNTSSTYLLSGCTASSWSVTCGATITSSNGTSCTVLFNSTGCGTVQVSANGTTATPKTVTITASALVGGTISDPTQSISYNATPALLSATAASGGSCLYGFTYQWYSAPDDLTWTAISGATSQNYQPGPLIATTYYYRKVTSGSSSTSTTNNAVVTVRSHDYSYNFIQERVILKPGVTTATAATALTSSTDVSQTTQFYDGMGRKIQTVEKQETPLLNDLVNYNVYDNFGREATKYLPYSSTENDGFYKTTAVADQNTFNTAQFPGETDYYAQINFEASDLNRPVETLAPGTNWVASGRGIGKQYLINSVADSVQQWAISRVQMSIPTNAGPYPAGTLYKSVTTDEQGNSVVEYMDMSGNTVLKKVQASTAPSTGHFGWNCTYYIYDTLQHLRFVIQPQAVADINGAWTISTTIANELCFRYEYDGRNRMVIKKTAGAGQTWIVYDARNRKAMIQDSLLRSQQKWVFTKYDSENRPDSTGTITDPTNYNNPAYHDSLAYYSTSYPVVASYTNELMTMKFYDDYSWISTYGAPVGSAMSTTYTGNSNYFITSYNTSPVYAVAPTPFAVNRSMPTGAMQKVIGTTNQYLYSVDFYDDRGRVIQTQSVNYTAAIDTVTVQYNFWGAALRGLVNHSKLGNTPQGHIVVTKLDYDQAMRLRHVWKNIDNAATDQLIDSMQYNELGQLRAKYLGNDVDSLIYDYNIRGWLIGINRNYVAGTTTHYFGMELGYDKTTSFAPGNTYVTPEYNGNIEGTVWKTAGSAVNRKYDYVYDNSNRLAAANFTQYNGSGFDLSAGINFSATNLSYDANGNILTMRQYGFMLGGSNPIDELQYTYQPYSNKLSQVYDTANNPTTLLGDFHWSGTKQSSDYSYDGNGDQTLDNNRNIGYIHYNFLSLPDSIVFTGKGYIKYTYDAAGTKLQKTIVDNVANKGTIFTYIGGFVYERSTIPPTGSGAVDTLQLVIHEEGRIRWALHRYTNGQSAYKFEYDFFERDQQGNTRMVLTQEHDTTNYLASMEAAYRSTESLLFGNILTTCYAWSNVPNSGTIPSGTKLAITNPNDSTAKVDYNGSAGQENGPSLLLKVMSGDTVSIGVQSFYNSNTITTTNSSLTGVLSSLALALANTPNGGAEGSILGFESTTGPVYAGLSSFLSTKDPAPPSGYPKAYLNWVFLDDQFNYVSGSSGSVAAASSTYPATTLNTVAPGGPIVMPKNGYLYVWVSNETQGWDVFFDNLSVQYKQGPVLEENHYYPFGLTMAGISDKALKGNYVENKYRYDGGAELQNEEFSDGSGWQMYETAFRSYDPQIGRFAQIDPEAEQFSFYSAYQYSMDNPVLFNDPTGADNLDQATMKWIMDLFQQAGDGFTEYIVDGDGNFEKALVDPDPQVIFKANGQEGVLIHGMTMNNDGFDGHYNQYQDQFVGGQMNTMNYVAKFVSVPDLPNIYNAYNTPGFWDYAKAVGSIALGGVEMLTAAATGGAGAILAVDGAGRAIMAIGKLGTLMTQGKVAAMNVPTNLLGAVGAMGVATLGWSPKVQAGMEAVDNLGAMFLGGANPAETVKAFQYGETLEGVKGTLEITHTVTGAVESYNEVNEVLTNKP
jgi:RHS repeat-associated protein